MRGPAQRFLFRFVKWLCSILAAVVFLYADIMGYLFFVELITTGKINLKLLLVCVFGLLGALLLFFASGIVEALGERVRTREGD